MPKDEQLQLMKWKKKLESAKNNWNYELMNERELIYNGTHEVDSNINNPTANRKKANNVQNIVFEFIESQVNTNIPQPTVKSKRPQFKELAQMIEDSIKNDLQETDDINRINDENERITPVQGFSLVKVHWNPDYKHHLYRGELELTNPHPKTFIPQAGVFEVQKMDYFFLLSSQTKNYVKRRYDVELETQDGEEYPEINYFAAEQSFSDEDSEKVTVIECWYKDKDGDIGKFVWANETILENMPKFYYRRLERCTKCGAVKGVGEECQNEIPDELTGIGIICGNKKFKESIEEVEELIDDVILPNGTVIPAGTEIPYYQPTKYPVIVRRNVPVNFQLGGQSDVDMIRDQSDALKKIVSSIEEKILRGPAIITALEDHRFNLTNELYQIIRGNQGQLAALNTLNLTADIQKELAFAQYLYKAAQDTLGITNSFMGKEDTTAKSGVAKQIQVQQASGRMQSKQFNKYSCFKQLFEIMFEFKLAYYDELRPYIKKGEGNRDEWGDFNKYMFLQQDSTGQWYYNTDFLFTADAGDGLPRDKMWIFNTVRELATQQLIDKAQAWTILETVDFPMAAEVKEQAIQEKEMAIQQQQMQAQAQMQPPGQQPPQIDPQQALEQLLSQFPPEMQEQITALIQNMPDEAVAQLMQAPPEMQVQLIQEALGGGQ